MKALLIAEKPSLMRDIQKVYKKMQHPYEVDFTSFVGHVVELKEPHEYRSEWKKWDLNVLPMIPERYEFRVKKSAYKVYKEIEQLLKTNQYDFIINACDAGMEGENIFYSFYKRVGCRLPVKRFWTSQTTDGAISKALLNLIDEQDTLIRNLRNAAMYRSIFDWLIGLNLTRAATVKGGRIIKIGRVMTPTLAIVVKRELEILQFKPEPYFQIELDLGQFRAIWFNPQSNENKLKTVEEAREVVSKISRSAFVRDIRTERKTIGAPPLHSLLELQKEANKFFGFTSSETLKIAQSLYEKKLITYPRTESKHLPTGFAQNIRVNLQALASLDEYVSIVQDVMSHPENIQKTIRSKKYVDDKKLTDHHAITVTEVPIGRKKLTPQESKIYHLIAKRLLAIFLPAYVIDKTAVVLQSNDEFFKANGNMVIDKGYTVLYDLFKKKQEIPLPPLHKDMEVPISDAKILSKMTEPPARYTDSSLLDAMFHAGRFIEDKELQRVLKDAEGIGTSATRAEIIEKLISIGMIAREGKSFKATQFGIDVIQSIGNHDIVSPELTAIWSKKLKDIVDGQLSSGQFYKEMLAYVKQSTDGFVSLNLDVAEKQIVVVGKCLQCGQAVVEGFKGYSCSNKACKFFISKSIMKGKITPTDAKKLLTGKETREIRFTWKSGKKGKAKLKLVNEKLEFVFSHSAKK
ncbi:DNA topoisomerase [Lysinibacillus sp. SGAir0095]|uniref:DNA topoisomerase n=1 Tax=Lysinibacillus sp. SGAir0095 TaxID=2070463 RepID=UPI0010CD6371|nr:DNA topoisomerase [Lysinibacillus sp. SGAir0095]QCR32286.1 type IA DNA topoisomerase [Lysinibacillus sp. SGAir0095]